MNITRIFKIYIKEIKEIIRTSGLIFILVIVPMIIYPFMLYYTEQTALKEKNKIDSASLSIFIKEPKLLPNLSEYIPSDEKIKILKNGNYEKIDKDCNLIISLEKQPDLFQSGYSNINATLIYDSTDKYSLKALNKFEEILLDVKKEITYERFDEKNIPSDIMTPISINTKNIASVKKITGNLLGNIIPFLLITFIMSGAMQIAVDITAGEKDRKTIQTLLISPAMRSDIIISKLLVVITVSLFCGFMNLLSMYITVCFMKNSKQILNGMNIDIQSILLGILVAIPLIIFLSSILTAIGVASKNQVEAGLYTMPLFFLDFLPLIALSSVEIANISNSNFFIPVYNTALAIKLILISSFTWQHILITVFSNLLYSAFFIFLCIKLFSNEDVIFSGIGDTIGIFFRKLFIKR